MAKGVKPFPGLNDDILRFSMLSDAIQCPHRYKVKYVDKLEATLESSYFTLGKIVHNVAEQFVLSPITITDPRYATLLEMQEYAMDLFKKAWIEAFDEKSIFILDTHWEKHSHAVKKTNEYGEKVNGKPYTSPEMTKYWKENFSEELKLSENAINAMEYDFPAIKFRSAPIDIYVQAKTCVQNFVGLHRADFWENGPAEIVFCEYKIKVVDLDNIYPGAKMGGTIDRINLYPNSLLANLLDYKSGKKKYEEFDVGNSDQLCWYSSAIEREFGIRPQKIAIWDLFNNQIVSHELTDGDMERFKKRLTANIRYKAFLDEYIAKYKDVGLEIALPVPIGNPMKIGCPCDLLWETDPALKCPYGELYLKNMEK